MRLKFVLLITLALAACTRPSPTTPQTHTAPPAAATETPQLTPAAPTRSAPLTSLRNADWPTVLRNDPDLERQVVSTTPGSGPGDLYVRYKAQDVAGYPELEDIAYGDLNGDGSEEAVISLHSGGTAGTVGLLIYTMTASGPRIVAARSGYKLRAQIEGGKLVLRNAVYAGWEPNCCPSSIQVTHYRLQGNNLITEADRREPVPELRLLTVERFYTLLDARQYEEAYRFLSPSFQAANPYAPWVAGFATTQRVAARVGEGRDGSVSVELTVTERTGGGGVQTRRFQGRWSLVFSNERNQWLLDRAEIQEVA